MNRKQTVNRSSMLLADSATRSLRLIPPERRTFQIITHATFLRSLRIISRTAGILVIFISGLVLFGWLINDATLKSIYPTLPSMKANAAISLICAAVAYLLSTSRWRGTPVQKMFAVAPLLIGFLTLSQYITGVNLGIDELFFTELPGEVGTTSPGRMAPNTALLLILYGLTLLTLGKKFFGRQISHVLLLLVAVILTPTVVGYIYNIDFIFGLATYTKMAAHTAVAFLLLLIAIPLSRTKEGFMEIVTSSTSGGFLARRLLLLAVVLPLLIGWFVLFGFRTGLYDVQFRFLLLIVLFIFVFAYFTWRTAYTLHRLDRERREMAKSLRHREERFRTLIEQSSDAIQLINAKGEILYTSDSIKNVLGFTSEELLGKEVPPFVHPDDLPIFMKVLKEVLKNPKKHVTVEYRVKHKDRSWAWIEVTGVNHLRTPNINAIVGTFRNITKRKELERQKDEFMGIVSHELKTPVTSIKAFTQVLEKRFAKEGDERSTLLLGKMDGQINKLTALIGDLLDATKIEGGKLQFNEDYFYIDEIVGDIVEEIQRTTERHRIVKEGSAKKTIFGDKDRIGQVIINLLTNAIKYSPQPGRILVKVAADKTFVTLCIQDFGVGIPKSKQRYIFERFYRVSGEKYDTVPGMGLGLFIASEIITRQQGKIWVESTEGKGSTFCFRLPIRKRQLRLQQNSLSETLIQHE